MSRKPATGRVGRLAQIAERQHGVVSRDRLLWLGLSPATISRWVAAGRLIRIYRGVYAVGRGGLDARGRWMAAALTYGRGALLSHHSAAAHWGLLPSDGERIDISLPSPTSARAREGIRVHRARLYPQDRHSKERIPLTSPARTLLDLADVVRPEQLRRALESCERLRLFDLGAVEALLARSPGRRGLKVLRELLADSRDDPPELRSEAEHDFRELCLAAGLSEPATNVTVEGLLVDAYWPAHGVVVEIDGYSYHRSREQFERDRERTEHLQLAGLVVLRFAARRIRKRPGAVEHAVKLALERSRRRRLAA